MVIFDVSKWLIWERLFTNQANQSRVAQRKRAGPITQRSMDRNHPLLVQFQMCLFLQLVEDVKGTG